ncbi:DNA-binding protein [Actinomadura sp. B10D3]|uniref:DNA-binding protein n=1 Tax=Actinomadura sp. B10D3 TaxID=3153557 RepID=UPI00325D4DB9
MTPAEIRMLPAMVDVVTAGRAIGVGRTKSYALARAGEFPCRVLRIGGSYLVPTAGLLALLGLDPAGCPEPGDGG